MELSFAKLPSLGYFALNKVRSLGFTAERIALETIAIGIFPDTFESVRNIDRKMFAEVEKSLEELLKTDARNIEAGIYPPQVLWPERPTDHIKRIPFIVLDAARSAFRRRKGKTTVFSKNAKDLADELPRYYRRNFHFQTDGYLSEHSAELYEHQVEILFAGGADAMRRLIIKGLRERFGSTDGRGLSFLELGCGTGRATHFVHLAFPKAKIVAVDLSAPYLQFANKKITAGTNALQRINLLQADAAELPFKDQSFDAVYSVFLFHELPLEQRDQVLKESVRVAKPNGFIGLVDSLQSGDRPEFDAFLQQFPQQYHEPFYRNYLANPMEPLLERAGVKNLSSGSGFFSKYVFGSV